jgi:hypothetical protein
VVPAVQAVVQLLLVEVAAGQASVEEAAAGQAL